MSWDRIEGQSKHRSRRASTDELVTTAGKHEDHVEKVREKYRVAKREAKNQVDEGLIERQTDTNDSH